MQKKLACNAGPIRSTHRMMRFLLLLTLLLLPLGAFGHAERLEGDAARDAKKRARQIKKDWKNASKAEKLVLLKVLARLPERTVGKLLEDYVEDEEDIDTASMAALAWVEHGEADDADDLLKIYKKAKDPTRKAAAIRWLGRYGENAPLKDLGKAAMEKDASSIAAVRALADAGDYDGVALAAEAAGFDLARSEAVGLLLAHDDERGVEFLAKIREVEEAARVAHYAIATDLETKALEQVLTIARGKTAGPYFASLLGRLTFQASHDAVVKAADVLDVNAVGWWLIGISNGAPPLKLAKGWLRDDEKDRRLRGLRYFQRVTEPLVGQDAEAVLACVESSLGSDDDELKSHAMLTASVTHVCDDKLKESVAAWIDDENADRRTCALLCAGRGGLTDHNDAAIKALTDECWYVASAALDALLHLRPKAAIKAAFDLAKSKGEGRLYAEALVLLRDLTGVDHGDDLKKWDEWIRANPDAEPVAQGHKSLRGVGYTRVKDRSRATFFGIEIESRNLEFASDRSYSMSDAVRREPNRVDFTIRKQDLLKRRPEVGRMMRGGFLPRFYVAACELSGALDALPATTKFGVTLFNTDVFEYAKTRTENGDKERRDAINWMLSTDIKGGTDIKNALLAIIKKGECDTILLLSDGEPMSLGIIEEIRRANAIRRVNIHVVSIHKHSYNRHYLATLAALEGGQIINAEPMVE